MIGPTLGRVFFRLCHLLVSLSRNAHSTHSSLVVHLINGKSRACLSSEEQSLYRGVGCSQVALSFIHRIEFLFHVLFGVGAEVEQTVMEWNRGKERGRQTKKIKYMDNRQTSQFSYLKTTLRSHTCAHTI